MPLRSPSSTRPAAVRASSAAQSLRSTFLAAALQASSPAASSSGGLTALDRGQNGNVGPGMEQEEEEEEGGWRRVSGRG